MTSLFFLVCIVSQFDRVVLDTVDSPQSLAYNNSHKVVFMSWMGRDTCHIVYEKEGDVHFIMKEQGWGISFSQPENVTNSVSSSSHPAVAMDTTQGIVYCAFDEDGEIYLTERDSAGNWSGPRNISNSGDSLSLLPAIVVDQADSVVYIVWQESIEENTEVYFRRLTGDSLGEVMNLSQTSDSSGFPTICKSDTLFSVAWEEKVSGFHEIQRKDLVNDVWGATYNVSQTPTRNSRHPSFAMGLLRNTVVTLVWEEDGDVWARSDDGWVDYNKSGTTDRSRYPTVSTVEYRGGCPTWAYLFWSEDDTLVCGSTYYSMEYSPGPYNWTGDQHSTISTGSFSSVTGANLVTVEPDTASPDKYLLCYYYLGYPIGVDEGESPRRVSELRAEPNPLAGTALISYCVPGTDRSQIPGRDTRQVDLQICDITGRRVVTLADRDQKPGTHQVTWDARQAPAGVYFAKLTIDGCVQEARKLISVK